MTGGGDIAVGWPLVVTVVYLGLSLWLYVLTGGADFGAGILELFSRGRLASRHREITYKAMGPVWEANHMWLIIAVVILFMGFPAAYARMSVYLHLPLTIMLFGIILRGCAFTFRHYDAVRDRSQAWYTWAFAASSLLTPLFLGVLAGAVTLASPAASPADGFFAVYVSPWLRPFPFAVGAFTCCLCAFLASVYLIGETEDASLRRYFSKRAAAANVLCVITGALVFWSAQAEGFPLLHLMLTDPVSLSALGIASLSLPPLWMALVRRRRLWARVLAGLQVTLILVAWFEVQFPYLLRIGGGLTFVEAAAPQATLTQLAGALLIGTVLFMPAFIYLLRVFKASSN